MKCLAGLLALTAALLGSSSLPAGTTRTAASTATLEQACILEGRSDGAVLRGKQSPNYAQTINQTFSATSDPTARTTAAAEAKFVQLVASGSFKLSVAQLVADDPITGYCKAVFPAAYFSGSRIVSDTCHAALAALAKLSPASSRDQRLPVERATLTACASRAEWLQGAGRSPARRLDRSRGADAVAVLKSLCSRNRATRACMAK